MHAKHFGFSDIIPHVTIGIAAYNAEHNIRRLLSSLCTQIENGFVIDGVVVYSDCSDDDTVALAQGLLDTRINVIAGKKRVGFIGAVMYLLRHSSADITILLNDDIVIEDTLFVQKIVEGFEAPEVGLVCGNPQPLKSRNFISKAINSSFYAYHNMALRVRQGNSMHTYDGKIMALSRAFKDSLVFPKDNRLAGNVDSFIYFSCLHSGYTYRFVKDAVVYYKSPTNMRDFLRWFIRNNANEPLMKEQFGSLVDSESEKPRMLFIYFLFIEFLKNPLGCLFIFCMGFYVRVKAQQYAKDFRHTWEVVKSTKDLAKV